MLEAKTIDLFVKKCIHCGFCKTGCPMYMEFREEKWSARGIIFIVRDILKDHKDYLDDWDFIKVVYACTLCGNCYTRCPAKIDVPSLVLELRKKIISENFKKSTND
ncbi:MAG: 4Fe-4S dicluster domain-containing protein [Candidatus Njordarchaeia archaeon]